MSGGPHVGIAHRSGAVCMTLRQDRNLRPNEGAPA